MNPYRFAQLLDLMTPEEQSAFEDRAFREWMKKVDAALIRKCSLGSADLPDKSYRDRFDDGADPAEMAEEVFEECAEEMGLDPEDFE